MFWKRKPAAACTATQDTLDARAELHNRRRGIDLRQGAETLARLRRGRGFCTLYIGDSFKRILTNEVEALALLQGLADMINEGNYPICGDE